MFRSFSGTNAVFGFAYVIVSLPRTGLVVAAPHLGMGGIRSVVFTRQCQAYVFVRFWRLSPTFGLSRFRFFLLLDGSGA